jgi:hypothetical protein
VRRGSWIEAAFGDVLDARSSAAKRIGQLSEPRRRAPGLTLRAGTRSLPWFELFQKRLRVVSTPRAWAIDGVIVDLRCPAGNADVEEQARDQQPRRPRGALRIHRAIPAAGDGG